MRRALRTLEPGSGRSLAYGADRGAPRGPDRQRYMEAPASERAETALLHWRVYRIKAEQLANEVRSYEETFLDRISLSTADITDEASHGEATQALQQAKYERDRDEILFGRAFHFDAREGDALELRRYETSLERSLFRTLSEFRYIQDQRRDRPPPRMLDSVRSNPEETV